MNLLITPVTYETDRKFISQLTIKFNTIEGDPETKPEKCSCNPTAYARGTVCDLCVNFVWLKRNNTLFGKLFKVLLRNILTE